MAETKVEIEVELSGSQKVEKQLEDIEGGLEGLGETGSKLAESLGSTNEKLGEGLEAISGSVGEVRGAFGELGSAIGNLGQTGAKGLLGLIGPLGMVVGAALTVYETFRLITGAAQEAEEAQEAMNAAAADLQSKLEALAEKGVIPTTKELHKFSLAVIESQLAKENIETAMTKYRKQFDALTTAKKRLAKATEEEAKAEKIRGAAYIDSFMDRIQAEKDLIKAREIASKAVDKFRDTQLKELKVIQEAAEMEQEFEKRTTDSLKADAKKLAALQNELILIKARTNAKGDEIAIADAEAAAAIRKIKLEEELEDANHEQTEAILKRVKASQFAISAESLELEKLREKQREILKKEKEEQEKKTKELRGQAKQRAAVREAEMKKQVALQSQLNQIEIRMTKEGIDQQIALENERHRATLELLKDGSKEAEVEEKRHLLNMLNIEKAHQSKKDAERSAELDKIKENNQKRLELEFDLARRMIEMEEFEGATDFGKVEFESNKRLELLQIEFDREIELAKMKGEEITSLEEKFALERLAIQRETVQEQTALITDYFDKYASGFVEAAYGAIFFGESFQESVAQILRGLGEQAAVQALLETAEGISKLAGGNPAGAANLKSAALFAAAAAAAGVASNALGGGGTATAGGTVSPTGTPTTAPTPERERAEESTMVFNINFGGAVVYDTKKAAEQALADRLVTIMNTPRRGAVQFNRR